MIEYTPTQIIRSHFDEVVEWRSRGISWAQIGNELHLTDKLADVSTLRVIYQYERQRRTTPQYVTAVEWALANKAMIADLLNKGVDWGTIVAIVSRDNIGDGTKPKLEMLIEAYASIVSRTPAHSASSPTHETNRDLASVTPAAVAPVDPPTQQGIQALKTEHESSVIRIPSSGAPPTKMVPVTRSQNNRGGHEVKTRNKLSKPTPIQVVRARFTEITEWRSRGVTWAEICDQLQSAGLKISTKALCTIYQREFKRRNSPPCIAAAQWARENSAEIANLRDQGASWLAILDSVPPQPGSNGDVPTLNMLITEYELVASHKRISTSIPIRQTDNEARAALKDSASPFHQVM
ncbi:MAG: hypothetical protein ACYCU8_06585 [Ferrimicrobium acidiphilum]